MPFDVRKPKDHEWGTCLCIYCVHPQLKMDSVSYLKLMTHKNLDVLPYAEFESVITSLNDLKNSEKGHIYVVYNGWQKLEQQKKTKSGKKCAKVTRKVPCSAKFSKFIDLLIADITHTLTPCTHAVQGIHKCQNVCQQPSYILFHYPHRLGRECSFKAGRQERRRVHIWSKFVTSLTHTCIVIIGY